MTDMTGIAETGSPGQGVIEVEPNKQLPQELGGFSGAELQQMPMALRIWFDPRIVRTIERMAQQMARSEVAVPPHLRNKPFACASVCRTSLLWRLNPDGVAMSTFQTPGGTLGFFGRLCNAIVQASGRLKEPPGFRHEGDWSKVTRKFKLEESTKKTDEHGKPQKYAVRTWTDRDAEDLGVVVTLPLKDMDSPIEFEFWLQQAFPMFSTLWATDPKTQIMYTSIRRACNARLPGLMLGVPFDDDAYGMDLRDITPMREALLAPAPVDLDRALRLPATAGEHVNPETGEVTQTAALPAQASAQQATGAATGQEPRQASSPAGEARSASAEPSGEPIQTVDWRGHLYQKPGSARRAALKEIAAVKTAGVLADLADPTKVVVDDLHQAGAHEFAAEVEQAFIRKRNSLSGGANPEPQPEPTRYHPETGEVESVPGDGSEDTDDDAKFEEDDAYQDWLRGARERITGAPTLGHLRAYQRQLLVEAQEYGAEAVAEVNKSVAAKEQALKGATQGMG